MNRSCLTSRSPTNSLNDMADIFELDPDDHALGDAYANNDPEALRAVREANRRTDRLAELSKLACWADAPAEQMPNGVRAHFMGTQNRFAGADTRIESCLD